MKRFLILAAVSGFFFATGPGTHNAYGQYDDRYETDQDYENEYDYEYNDRDPQGGMFAELNFYGKWYHVSAFGWVWRPYVGSGWRPYHQGHWVSTRHGWMWVGYEPFAWAAYHYGNWTYQPRLGWIWIPGYDWAPSRVEWIVYDDYICWAPRPPRRVHIGYPWSVSRVNVWVTVRADHFTDQNVGRHIVRPKFKAEHAERAYRQDAPDVRVVERYKGRPVNQVDVNVVKSQKGKREFTRVELPADQVRIRERNSVQTPTKAKYEASRPSEHPKSRAIEPSKQRSKQPANQPSKQSQQKGQSEKKKKAAKSKD